MKGNDNNVQGVHNYNVVNLQNKQNLINKKVSQDFNDVDLQIRKQLINKELAQHSIDLMLRNKKKEIEEKLARIYAFEQASKMQAHSNVAAKSCNIIDDCSDKLSNAASQSSSSKNYRNATASQCKGEDSNKFTNSRIFNHKNLHGL